MKKESGLTLVKVIILLLILVVIIVGTIYFAKNIYQKEDMKRIETDMLLIQGKTNMIGSQANINKDDSVLKGEKLEEKKEEEFVQDLMENGILNQDDPNFSKYYILTQENLKEMGLDTIKLEQGNYYIVNYATEEIICTNGVLDRNGKKYYTLSSIQQIQGE